MLDAITIALCLTAVLADLIRQYAGLPLAIGVLGNALALYLSLGPEWDIVQTLTYTVVVFSILRQGLTIGTLARRICA